jgi:predicted permease
MERLVQDLKFAVRVLWKDRGFAVTALVTLAICIGANSAIFAIVNSVILRPLPVPEPDRLVIFYNSYPNAGVERGSTGVPDYYDRLRETSVFEEQALYQMRGQTVGGEPDPQRLTGMAVRPSFFRMLRARPLRGRVFGEDEGEIGHEHVVILSYALWQQAFGAADSAVGRELRINGVPHVIVGVMPPSFSFADPDVRLWTPLAFTPEQKSDDARHSNSWTMIARLKPGATVRQAQQQIDALNSRNLERFPALKQILINAGFHTVVAPLQDDMVRGVRPTLFLLWGGVLFVLAIGAVNITNLVLIRSSARIRELATRHALGAALSRLTRQLLTETVLLTLAGGGLGLAIGYGALTFLRSSVLGEMPRAAEVAMDVRAAARARAEPPAPEPQSSVPGRRTERHDRTRRPKRSPCARDSAGRVRVHTAHRRRPPAHQLSTRARRTARFRSDKPAHGACVAAGLPVCRRRCSADVHRAFALSRAFGAGGRECGHHVEYSIRRRLQRQRHPGRGLSDGAG